jgi:hypothetical protein
VSSSELPGDNEDDADSGGNNTGLNQESRITGREINAMIKLCAGMNNTE